MLLEGGRMNDEGCYLSLSSIAWSTAPPFAASAKRCSARISRWIPFATNEDAVRIYNDTEYGLSMAVVTENFRTMRLFRDECEYGMGYVNLPCIG